MIGIGTTPTTDDVYTFTQLENDVITLDTDGVLSDGDVYYVNIKVCFQTPCILSGIIGCGCFLVGASQAKGTVIFFRSSTKLVSSTSRHHSRFSLTRHHHRLAMFGLATKARLVRIPAKTFCDHFYIFKHKTQLTFPNI